MSEVRDLNDRSLYEDESEDPDFVALADSSSSKKSGGKGKVKNARVPDEDNEDDEQMEYDDSGDDEDAASMDDGDDDGDAYAEEDDDSGDEDIDHLPGVQKNRTKAKGKGGAKMSESAGRYDGLTLSEATVRLAELEKRVYLAEAEKILGGFERGTFTFTATEARAQGKKDGGPLGGQQVKRTGNYRLAPKTLKAIRTWLFSDAAFEMSEGDRGAVLALCEQIAAGVVDLSVRGSAHDMERQKTVTLKSPRERAVSKAADYDVLLSETAAEIAESRGKNINVLRTLQQRYNTRDGIEAKSELEQIYLLARQQINGNSAATLAD